MYRDMREKENKNIKVTEWGNKSRFCSTLQSLTWRERKKRKKKSKRKETYIELTLLYSIFFFSFFFSYFFSCMLKITLKCSVLYIVHQQKQRLANWYVLVSILCKYIIVYMLNVLLHVSCFTKCFGKMLYADCIRTQFTDTFTTSVACKTSKIFFFFFFFYFLVQAI